MEIVIDPEPPKCYKENHTTNTKPRKSKIPILSKISKTVANAKQGLMSYQKSAKKEIQVAEKGVNTRLTRTTLRETCETKEN